jgi:iron complex outermembrane receptor protein
MLSIAWKLSGTFTYTDATYKDNIGTLQISGKQVPFLPKYMTTISLDYKKNGYLFGANTKFNNDIYGTRDNKEKISNYSLTNMYIGYSKKLSNSVLSDVNAMFNVNNLFDVSYLATAGAFGDTSGSSTYFVGTPRNVSLTLGATF